jgi:hypothetical protein
MLLPSSSPLIVNFKFEKMSVENCQATPRTSLVLLWQIVKMQTRCWSSLLVDGIYAGISFSGLDGQVGKKGLLPQLV